MHPMAVAPLEPAHRLLACLAAAVRNRDPVLVKQIATRADLSMTAREVERTFSRLPVYGLSPDDLAWLRTADV